MYHVNFSRSGGQLEPCKLEFLRDRALKIDDEEVTLENMRYATRRPYKSFTQRAADCVILSYVGATRMVEHSFLEMPDVHDTLNLAQDFIKLLRNKYPENTDDKINEECLDTIYKQPLYFGDADVAVKDAKDKSIIYDGRCIVVLDIECLTIYPVTKEEVCGPPHRLMFWKEEGNDSVEKILHYSKDQKIAFETPAMIYELVRCPDTGFFFHHIGCLLMSIISWARSCENVS